MADPGALQCAKAQGCSLRGAHAPGYMLKLRNGPFLEAFTLPAIVGRCEALVQHLCGVSASFLWVGELSPANNHGQGGRKR